MPKGHNYLSFLLRAWKEHERAEWRFSIREISEDQQQYFSDFTGLVRFLADLLEIKTHETGGDDQQNQTNDESNAS